MSIDALSANQNLRGIAAMVLAVAVLSVMDSALKQLGESYAPLQVTSMRGMASLPFVLLTVALTHRWRDLRMSRWYLHVARGVLAITMLGLFIYSLSTLSLSSAYCIVLCAPLIITALSVPMLGERVDTPRWIAIVVGLIAVVYMLAPDPSEIGTRAKTLGALAALGAALCYAIAGVLIRIAARTETTLAMTVSFLVFIAVVAGAMAWPSWRPIQPEHYWIIAVLGLTGAFGQFLMVEAFRHAPASVVAPFDYTALVWGALLDFAIWNTFPNARMIGGGTVVVATGLFLIYRERFAR